MTASALLDIDQLSVTFGGLRAVNSLTFQVLSDHIHGLIGPNGAGKTTVFNVITRIYRPDLGGVSLLGRNMLALSSDTRWQPPGLHAHFKTSNCSEAFPCSTMCWRASIPGLAMELPGRYWAEGVCGTRRSGPKVKPCVCLK